MRSRTRGSTVVLLLQTDNLHDRTATQTAHSKFPFHPNLHNFAPSECKAYVATLPSFPDTPGPFAKQQGEFMSRPQMS